MLIESSKYINLKYSNQPEIIKAGLEAIGWLDTYDGPPGRYPRVRTLLNTIDSITARTSGTSNATLSFSSKTRVGDHPVNSSVKWILTQSMLDNHRKQMYARDSFIYDHAHWDEVYDVTGTKKDSIASEAAKQKALSKMNTGTLWYAGENNPGSWRPGMRTPFRAKYVPFLSDYYPPPEGYKSGSNYKRNYN